MNVHYYYQKLYTDVYTYTAYNVGKNSALKIFSKHDLIVIGKSFREQSERKKNAALLARLKSSLHRLSGASHHPARPFV